MSTLREDCDYIVTHALSACMPDKLVISALQDFKRPKGRLILVAIGKAAFKMAEGAALSLSSEIDEGIVITKYGHSYKSSVNTDSMSRLRVYEAGHPLADENSVKATEEVLKMTENLTSDDEVLFLISGGGSALFESPDCSLKELQDTTERLLKSGADIYELNRVRSKLSKVKDGKFAEYCKPAHITALILSDVLGDKIDVIASGPAIGDNVETKIIGNVELLCNETKKTCEELGYKAEVLTTSLTGYAVDAGAMLAAKAREEVSACDKCTSRAFIYGGETTVVVKGKGCGGRNTEIALSAALGIENLDNVAIFSIGSDGTDGPTDAAGGFVDSSTVKALSREVIRKALEDNDSYNALKKVNSLIVTGPTNTNLNDVSVVLVKN